MNRKVIIGLLLLVSIFAISHVSAVEDVTCDGVSMETQNITAFDDGSIASESQNLEESNDVDEIIKEGSKSHDDRIIQEQIDNATPGETINLTGSTYNCDLFININKTITIDGKGSTLVFDPSDKEYFTPFVFVNYTASHVTLKNIKFKGGTLIAGGAIFWLGDYGSIINCTFTDNKAIGENGTGGAIFMKGNYCNLTNCIFDNNLALLYGGAVLWNGTGGIINNCEFNGNTAKKNDAEGYKNHGGALVLVADDCIISNCNFTNNYCNFYGGAISVLGNRNHIINCNFYDNYVSSASDDSGNRYVGGGAIFSACNGLAIYNCEFIGNNASNSIAGAINLADNDTVVNSFFQNNHALKYNVGDIEYVMGNHLVYYGNYSFYKDNIKSNTFLLEFNETEGYAIGIFVESQEEEEQGLKLLTEIISNNQFNRTKHNSTVEFGGIGMILEYGSSRTIRVIVQNGDINLNKIHVLNHDKSKTVNAKIDLSDNHEIITVSGLEVGNYFLRVTTITDENLYNEATKDLSITVNKATAAIKASTITVAYKKGSLWTVKIVDSRDNKPIKDMKLTLKVYTGNKFTTVNLNTNANGEASYQTKGLSASTHKVVVSGTHKGYKLNPITSSIKVVKQTALKIKVKSKKISIGAVLSITVTNKKTKKGVNGVKIQLLIKDGKKYKTVILKTKKKGKTKGFCGYATNKLTVGKHSVKITPVEIKYAGSASSSMKITPKAKKVPAWETKA